SFGGGVKAVVDELGRAAFTCNRHRAAGHFDHDFQRFPSTAIIPYLRWPKHHYGSNKPAHYAQNSWRIVRISPLRGCPADLPDLPDQNWRHASAWPYVAG